MIESVFRRYLKSLIIILTVGIILSFFLIPAWSVSYFESTDDIMVACKNFKENASNPFTNLKKIFKKDYISTYINTLKWFWAIYVLFILIIWVKLKPKREYDDIEHGSSDWAKFGEQYKNNSMSKNDGFILAEKNCLPVKRRGNLNVLIAGGSGSGKSTAYVIPNVTQLLGSYVFTDPKGELYDRTAGYFKKKGYRIQTLNLVKPEFSDAYNPLLHIRNNIDVDIIAYTIVKGQSDSKGSDPFWEDMAEITLKALIFYLLATRPPEEQSLSSCANLVRAAFDQSNGGENLLGKLMAQLPQTHQANLNYKSISGQSDKTLSSILGTLQSKLGKFDSKDIQELTSSNTIDFEALGKQKTVLYVIPPDSHSAYNFLLTIFFSQMIQQLYDFADSNGGKLKEMVVFMLDEFPNIGKIPDFEKKISTSRSRNISFSVIVQTLDQLTDLYEDAAETIMANCDTHLFLGGNSLKTAEHFSKALGEKTIVRDNLSMSRDKDNVKSGMSYSDQIMARPLLTPDEIRRLDPNYALILVKGLKPIKERKYYYFEHPVAKELKRCEISHNDISNVVRGEYKIFNPFAIDDEINRPRTKENITIESLDIEKEKKNEAVVDINIEDDELPEIITSNQKNDYSYDIQKELEIKFDELFGNDDEE